MLADVTGSSCQRYVKERASTDAICEPLSIITQKKGLHRGIVRVVLPAKGVWSRN
jgi:hypothetical protein